MITQEYKQGIHNIKIESAESVQDAQRNGFIEGQYSRYFLDGKKTDNYNSMINFIMGNVDQTLVPTEKDLNATRDQMLATIQKETIESIDKLKKQYIEQGQPKDVIDSLNEMIKNVSFNSDKLDQFGVRVVE